MTDTTISITESDLLAELAAHYGGPPVQSGDVTANRIAAEIRTKGGRASERWIEQDMQRRVRAGEFICVPKKSANGRMVNVYVKP